MLLKLGQLKLKKMPSYNKLVRDKIPQILDQKGISYEKRVASPEEYKVELIKKLGEEVKEFDEDGDLEELADVVEVVEALKKLPEYKGVEESRRKKREARGGFDQKIILKGEKQ
jgi:predicted house-cleaning noncanonical NTP pyrophosphatase (MazG superfamily)